MHVSEKSDDTGRSPSGYEPAASPYDQPTERIGGGSGAQLPRTDDELDADRSRTAHPTEKLTGYPGDTTTAGRTEPAYDDSATRAIPVAGTDRTATPAEVRPDVVPERRGTLDLGLLILRVSVGAIVLVHGLQKLTGWFDGPGLSGFQEIVAGSGYDQARLLSILGAVGEVAGGALLILGLATPLAGAAVLAVMINAWLVRQVGEPGLQFFAPAGVEYETLLVLASASIILTGPGRIAVDGGRGWARRPFIGSFLALAIGIGGAAALWIFLNGADPFA
ncbi:DoxX family protein [Rhodococcus sp. BP-149]|uniref:DoxX family protein n=1 Tax=unclassified Rhodococcus (in: high G+C Gram-positive bacteria) TaxID=192944 RepID=UPI001C9A3775|nr:MULTISPECIES: DoxX family protein [unclassified Rhodococcus (in: high G+C Gram-positive bacteria)]MBY6694525.1 DoxX family protein [Rhodococcus sp. BP-188]MBY6711321.1 DoxX family protein [Rhodococcus sp. BP-160]MBY6718923.1 DoxX family protein [Rhodococcus sp. BP-142]MBY6727249.1 DoxX family protein [Rhodococcus sp. BP-107]MBY6685927.1 DoxX family protein [Rhodococcus sp. BP-288]